MRVACGLQPHDQSASREVEWNEFGVGAVGERDVFAWGDLYWGFGVLGIEVLGIGVLGIGVLGIGVLGIGVLGIGVLGKWVLCIGVLG